MPMKRELYPPDWEQIARRVKDDAGWVCQACRKQCRRPGEPFDTHRNTLTVAHHPDPEPMNCAPDNLHALCAPCHCRLDAQLKARRHPKRRGQMALFGLLALLAGAAHARTLTGTASYYGPGFHGRRTFSGERFDMHAMTLACRHLPMGTRVRVTNLRNGRSAKGRVNDYGPNGRCRRRVADLSLGMARAIGLTPAQGTTKVRIERLFPR